MKKIGILIFAVLAIILASFIPRVNSQVRPYVSGDAINYDGKAYVGTTNTGSFELFQINYDGIDKELNIETHDTKYNTFHDLTFSEEDSRLYVYLVNGRDLIKYDITSPSSVRLVKKVKDNSGDYFFGLGQGGDGRIFTMGSKGVKVYNSDLVVVSSYRINLDYNRNLTFNNSGSNIYLVDDLELKAIDAFWRQDIMTHDLNVNRDHNRAPFIDSISGDVFVVDDSHFRQIKANGEEKTFKHIAEVGFDVAGVQGREYVYFSDGIGVVKMRKSDLKPLDWEWTSGLGGGNGWAMGLETVNTDKGEKLVVFNGSSILVMNSNLSVFDSYQAQENETSFTPCRLSLSRYSALPRSMITVYGSGFGFNEEIKIELAGSRFTTFSDPEGNFEYSISVPNVSPKNVDVKATGKISEKTYSVGFRID